MQIAMATLALAVAGYIVWHNWRTVVVRHSPAFAARLRVKRRDEAAEPPAPQPAKVWFAQPVPPAIDMKAARVRPDRPVAIELPPGPQPLRSGWNEQDDAALLRLVADEVPTAEIAAKLGRSENSVRLRIPLLNLRHRQAGHMAGQRQAASG